MSWPFTHVGAPNFRSGDSLVAVPTVLGAVPNVPSLSTQLWLLGLFIVNTAAVARTFQLFDGAGVAITPLITIAAGGMVRPDELGDFIDFKGLQWVADGADVSAKVWGYL